MLYLLTVLGVCAVSVVVHFLSIRNYKYDIEYFSGTVAMFAVALLVLSLMLLAVIRVDTLSEIQKVGAIQMTVEAARGEGVAEIERATLQNRIVTANEWIAKVQYRRSNKWISVYYPAEVLDLEFIR